MFEGHAVTPESYRTPFVVLTRYPRFSKLQLKASTIPFVFQFLFVVSSEALVVTIAVASSVSLCPVTLGRPRDELPNRPAIL